MYATHNTQSMIDILDTQFKSGRSLTQSKHYSVVKREHWPKFFWDMHPLAQDYYHELNPYFLFNMYRADFFKFAKVMTVRDGAMNFSTFLIDNIQLIPKLGTDLYLIHPSLAPLVPDNIASYFGSWTLSQSKQIKITEAKKIILFGFICEQYLKDPDLLPEKLKVLANIREDVEIELYIPIRKNIFERHSKESIIHYTVFGHILDALKGKKYKILNSEHFFQKTDFKNTYLLDLAHDNFLVSDNYLHYYVISKGGTVSGISQTPPKDSIYNLALSLHHELHVTPLPKNKNIFIDLLFYKKRNPNSELLYDPIFQSLVRDVLK